MLRRIFANKAITCGVLGVLALVALGGSATWYFAPPSNRSQALAVARTLGYTDDRLLVTLRYCQDLLTRCAEQVVFTTPESSAVFANRMAHGDWVKRESANTAVAESVFLDIDSFTTHRLTGNGWPKDDGVMPSETLPQAWKWEGTTSTGKSISIIFCQTAGQPVVYAFDGKRITDNIVRVEYMTRQ